MKWDDLSNREKQAIALAAYGLNNHHIALLLGISQRTVQEYRIRARRNLGLDSSADLRQSLSAFWADIVKLAAPPMLGFLERAAAQLTADLAFAEQEILARQKPGDRPG
jgi:DNA-binding CsgD family transcriptional regulator